MADVKREVIVCERNGVPEMAFTSSLYADAYMNSPVRAGKVTGVRYVPAVEQACAVTAVAGKCRQCGDAYADTTVTGCMSCLCFRKAAAEVGKAQTEWWVSVEERLPEEGVSVIVDGGSAYLSSSGEWRTASGNHREIQWKVTHWMPIPALPSPPAEASQLPAGETEEQRPACGVCGNPDAWPQSVGPRCAEHLVITPPTEPK
jgi:hypothetical protein